MTTRKTIITSLAFVLVLAAVAAAQPGTCGDRHHHRPGGGGPGEKLRVERLARVLDLTEEQQQAITAIQDEARLVGRQHRKEMARLQNQLEGEMLKDDPSEKVMVDLTEKLGAARTRLDVNRVKTRLAVRAQLTEEQQDQLATMRHRRHDLKPGGRGCQGPCDDADGSRGQRGQRERGQRGQGNRR